jgi:O6-methylguanine-DNA--protein-cysteine methyltransferase
MFCYNKVGLFDSLFNSGGELMVVKYSSPHNKHVFNALVWEIVRQIPAGKVATYGQIARLIPPPAGMNL